MLMKERKEDSRNERYKKIVMTRERTDERKQQQKKKSQEWTADGRETEIQKENRRKILR